MTDPHSAPHPTHPHPDAARNPRGRFQPGQSGNPAGKQPGTLNHATRLKQALEDGDFETAVQTIRARLHKGDFTAARLLIDRLDPKPRGRPIVLDVPDDMPMPERFAAVTRAMFRGEITPDEAKVMCAVLEAEDRARERAGKADSARAVNKLMIELYRPELERRLEETWKQCYAPDLHSACNSPTDEPPPPAPPPFVPPPRAGEGREGAGAAPLHSACISDPASVLPTPRRRAVNRLRAQAAAQARAVAGGQ